MGGQCGQPVIHGRFRLQALSQRAMARAMSGAMSLNTYDTREGRRLRERKAAEAW